MYRTLIALTLALAFLFQTANAQEPPRRPDRDALTTEMPGVHDPVMAKDGDTYYIFATGRGIQQMTSTDRKAWTVSRQPVMTVIPGWTTDSVPGFNNHVWAPDVIKWHDRWWMAYSCSTFGRNGSAIGLLSSRSLRDNMWKDEGCIVASRENRDNWNAIDPNFVIDDATDTPWLVWGSFWDGIQMVRLDATMHVAEGEKPRTVARRYDPSFKPDRPNPTSQFAGTNAIEAPFIFKHGGYYYLFVSWDYCCRGAESEQSRSFLLKIYDEYIAGASYEENMELFGKVSCDAPASISIYTDSFEDKDRVSECITAYNNSVDEARRITYTDYIALLTESITSMVNAITYVLIAFVAVSLVVSSIMIGIITHISVLERTKEIGILRSLGASKRSISQVFNAETFIIGLFAGTLGIILSLLMLIPINAVIRRFAEGVDVSAQLPLLPAAVLILISIATTMLGGLIPAKKAAKKDPVAALRSE